MIKVYLDEDVHKKAAYSLSAKGFDVLSTSEVNKKGLTDRDQLEFAMSLKRTLFTFNVRDFIKLHKEYVSQKREHFGIIISPQINISTLIKKLSSIIVSIKPEEIHNQIFWL
jgi:hypothetical protein